MQDKQLIAATSIESLTPLIATAVGDYLSLLVDSMEGRDRVDIIPLTDGDVGPQRVQIVLSDVGFIVIIAPATQRSALRSAVDIFKANMGPATDCWGNEAELMETRVNDELDRNVQFMLVPE